MQAQSPPAEYWQVARDLAAAQQATRHNWEHTRADDGGGCRGDRAAESRDVDAAVGAAHVLEAGTHSSTALCYEMMRYECGASVSYAA